MNINVEFLLQNILPISLYSGIAIWRLTSLATNETGPFYIFLRIRKFAYWLERKSRLFGLFHIHELSQCEWCLSIWIGAVVLLLWLWIGKFTYLALFPFQASAITIFMKYILGNLQEDCKAKEMSRRIIELEVKRVSDRENFARELLKTFEKARSSMESESN